MSYNGDVSNLLRGSEAIVQGLWKILGVNEKVRSRLKNHSVLKNLL